VGVHKLMSQDFDAAEFGHVPQVLSEHLLIGFVEEDFTVNRSVHYVVARGTFVRGDFEPAGSHLFIVTTARSLPFGRLRSVPYSFDPSGPIKRHSSQCLA